MAEMLVQSDSLVSIADIIREKGGTSDALVFPDGFVSAISAIQTEEYEISTGIITLSEDSESLSFEHGLSKAPSFVHIFLPIGYKVSSFSNSLRSMYFKKSFTGDSSDKKFDVYVSRSSTNYFYHENSRLPNDVEFDINDTTVTAAGCSFNGATVRKWLAGNPYHWICIAGEVVFPYK